jgi:hypothetical protein
VYGREAAGDAGLPPPAAAPPGEVKPAVVGAPVAEAKPGPVAGPPTSIPTPPAAVGPSAPPAATAAAPTGQTVAQIEPVLAGLDAMTKEVRGEPDAGAIPDGLVAGAVLTAGYVLLNTRAVYWLLSALLARPAVWRPFDPLEVITAWEREHGADAEDDESLQSMVGG